MQLAEILQQDIDTPSDINQHLPTLRQLAQECSHITEFGCWRGYSSTALLCGLHESEVDTPFKKLTIVDINEPYLEHVKEKLTPYQNNIEIVYRLDDTTAIEIEETDFLFIDTWHVYKQLKKELELHGNKATRYLAFHDTVSFGLLGEDGETPGLLDAIEEFLEANPHWQQMVHYEFNNGLMVLERVE